MSRMEEVVETKVEMLRRAEAWELFVKADALRGKKIEVHSEYIEYNNNLIKVFEEKSENDQDGWI